MGNIQTQEGRKWIVRGLERSVHRIEALYLISRSNLSLSSMWPIDSRKRSLGLIGNDRGENNTASVEKRKENIEKIFR